MGADVRDPLAAFDEAVLADVADAFARDETDLRRLVRRHQETVRANPGVEDIVYEWRRNLPGTSVIERRRDAYLLALPTRVWPEFRAAMDLSAGAYAALLAVHARQVERAGHEAVEGGDAMVLTRE